MSRDSGSSDPSQRTVAELLAEYGGSSQRSARRRRRRAEDPSETAPQAIIERVMSDSGQMRAVQPDAEPPRSRRSGGRSATDPQPQAPQPSAQSPVQQGTSSGGHEPDIGDQWSAPRTAAKQPPEPPEPPRPSGQPEGPAPSQGAPPGAAQAAGASAPAPAPAQAPAEPGGGSGFWARRFAAAPKPPNPAQPGPAQPGQAPPNQARPNAAPANAGPPEAGPAAADPEATIQQPPLRGRPQPFPRTGPEPVKPPVREDRTEQLPKVEAEAQNKGPGREGTALLNPMGTDADGDYYDDVSDDGPYEDAERDPYDYGSYDDFDDYDDDYDPELPAGMEAADYHADEDDFEDEDAPLTSGKDWLVLAVQVGAGVIAGGAVWFGFRWLWIVLPLAALVAALVITGCLVFIAFKFLRASDMQTILLTVLVGLICTVSPAALLLVGH